MCYGHSLSLSSLNTNLLCVLMIGMARIHPNLVKSCSRNSSRCSSSEKEVYTLWMKSLVFHGNGCTVFNSRGDVVYRVDNYQQRCSSKVFLMDSNGRVLFSIHKKKWLSICGCWEGYRWSDEDSSVHSQKKLWFRVMRNWTVLRKDISCRVILRCNKASKSCYTIVGLEGKSALKIVDLSGEILAEAVQKQSSKGVSLGDDVLTLLVESRLDQSFVMALVTIYGLINNKL